MKYPLLCAALLLCLTSCSGDDAGLSDDEHALVLALGFDVALMQQLRRFGESLQQLSGTTADYQFAPADGLVLATRPGAGRRALQQIRDELQGSDYSAYLNDQGFGFSADKIAIIKSTDDYDYLAMVRTDGINYDLEHEDVLLRYQRWDRQFGLSLTGAGLDWLEASFVTPPEDWQAFAAEVYAFCPDVVDQGTGDVASLADELRRANAVFLWWD